MTEFRLPPDADSAAVARRRALDAAADRLTEERRGDLALMVTELVTNAVRHGSPEPDGTIVVKVDVEDDLVRTAVIDGGTEFEFERATFDGRSEHFGLQLVDRLASRWGLSLDGEKAVWFEIDLER